MYGLGDDEDNFNKAYMDLAHRMLVYPPICEMRREGVKHGWIRQLDRMAKVDETPRPLTRVLTKETIPTEGKWVMKRDFSAHGDHVEIVDFNSMSEGETLQHALEDHKYNWTIQSYVPLLEQWGEWRVFLIEGKTRYVIMTTKEPGGNWSWNKTDSMFTLEKLT